MKPVIGITIGDPAGIGPEIVLKAAALPSVRKQAKLVIFGDAALLQYTKQKALRKQFIPDLTVLDFENVPLKKFRFGAVSRQAGNASGDYIAAAVRAAKEGMIDAIVTAPINKVSFRMGKWGKQYIGHTEMLASLTGAKSSALMLVHGSLRAVHVTSHIPLRQVPEKLNEKRIFETILLTDRGLRNQGIRRPKIAVCGLNPHASDNGLMGNEEAKMITPAIKKARRHGIRVQGPLPADTVWPLVRDGIYDVGVAMYHDQGQIAIKLHSFNASGRRKIVNGVNVTLGLPIIRTSVAHGTAYEIAGRGIASEQSLVDAINLAVTIAKNRKQK